MSDLTKAKGWKRHRWGLVLTYSITDKEARNVITQKNSVSLNSHNLLEVDVPRCLSCRKTYEEAKGTECVGKPSNLEVIRSDLVVP